MIKWNLLKRKEFWLRFAEPSDYIASGGKEFLMSSFSPCKTVIVLLVLFSLISCGNNSTVDQGVSALGETLNLSGQIYSASMNNNNIVYVEFLSDWNVMSDGIGGEGTITGGHLEFSIERPETLVDISSILFTNIALANFIIDPIEAQSNILDGLLPPTGTLSRMNISSRSGRVEYENIIYVYVDRDVNIRADRSVLEDQSDFTNIVNAFNFELIAGWNAVLIKETETYTSNRYDILLDISPANPSNLRWILY